MFVTNWASILKKAWSVRLMVASAAINGVVAVWPSIMDAAGLSMGEMMALTLGVNLLSVLARVVDQGIEEPKADA